MSRAWLSVLVVVIAWGVGSTVFAEGLPLTLLEPNTVRIDGSIGEWRGLRMRTLGSGAGGSMKYALGYDDGALYVAAQVLDDVMVRTRAQGRDEDAVVITLAIPTDAGMRVSELWLYAGIPGEQAAAALIGGPSGALGPIAGAQVIEGPLERGKGYVLEARVPWSSVPGGAQWMGAGGAVRLHDVDRGGRDNDVATARLDPARPEQLPRLAPSGIGAATLQGFMASRGVNGTPRFDLRGDVAGDRRPEQVAIVDSYVVVLGPGFRGGQSYSFAQLPVASSSDVPRAELVDVTGDGKAELVVTLRQQREQGSREVWQVFDFATEQPRVIFTLETRRQTRDGEVSATVQVTPASRGKPPTIEVTPNAARGLNESNFQPAREAGVEALLPPWGQVQRRQYQWEGARMVMTAELDARGRAVTSSATAVSSTSGNTSANTGGPVVSNAPPEPPPPPGVDDLVDAFRRAQGIDRNLEPRLKRNANVAEDARVEQLMLFDRSLLVIGPGYREGRGYFFYQLPVNDAQDIQRVFAADVTGDGRAEIFVRVQQRIGDVKRELLYVHQLDGNEFRQLLVVEVRRAQGDSAIGNIVRLNWQGARATLMILPGRAEGWSAGNYPFITDTSDGTDALLLPWSDSTVTYRFDGARLTR